jgi:hypothetical protein
MPVARRRPTMPQPSRGSPSLERHAIQIRSQHTTGLVVWRTMRRANVTIDTIAGATEGGSGSNGRVEVEDLIAFS